MDCLFESRSSIRGGVFWAPPSPLPPFPQGSGLSAQGFMLPPGARGLQGSELPAMLLDFFLASSPASRGPEARCPGFTLYFPDARARLPDFQASSMLSGDHAFRGPRSGDRGPGFHDSSYSRGPGPGVRWPGFPVAFRRPGSGSQAFRIPGARGLSGGQGPGLHTLTSHT